MKVNLESPPECILEDYRIAAFQLLTKPRKPASSGLDVECLFCPEKDADERYSVRLGISYAGGRGKKTFSLRVVVNGYFQWRGGYRQKEGNAFLAWVNFGLEKNCFRGQLGFLWCGGGGEQIKMQAKK